MKRYKVIAEFIDRGTGDRIAADHGYWTPHTEEQAQRLLGAACLRDVGAQDPEDPEGVDGEDITALPLREVLPLVEGEDDPDVLGAWLEQEEAREDCGRKGAIEALTARIEEVADGAQDPEDPEGVDGEEG